MTTIVGLPLGLALLLLAPLAAGQSNLGELLDTGAQKLSAEEFRRDIVQRPIVGATPAGATIELMYLTNGSIVGMGSVQTANSQASVNAPFSGQWTIDDAGRICASLQTTGAGTAFTGAAVLPQRCQVWFKLGDTYFVSDSDSDRRAKVLRRTIMDIQLPGMSGIDALKALRADPATAHIPVIAVTASVMQQDRKHITEAGFDAYLSKPLDIREFLATVKKIIEAPR